MLSKTAKESLPEVVKNLEDSYKRWSTIYEFGCSDPMWGDGVNIDLVRNHILYYRGRIEVMLKDNYFAYPDLYWIPIPPKLPCNFMAVDRAIQKEIHKETKYRLYGLPEKARDILGKYNEVPWRA